VKLSEKSYALFAILAVLALSGPALWGQSQKEAEVAARESWYRGMALRKVPKAGCFTASYPNLEWQETTCVAAPSRKPIPPVRRVANAAAKFEQAGNGVDYVAQAVGGTIYSAEGSFPKTIGVTSVASNVDERPVQSSTESGTALIVPGVCARERSCKLPSVGTVYLYDKRDTCLCIYRVLVVEFRRSVPGDGQHTAIAWRASGHDLGYSRPILYV
jgi:hypothetical protein